MLRSAELNNLLKPLKWRSNRRYAPPESGEWWKPCGNATWQMDHWGQGERVFSPEYLRRRPALMAENVLAFL